MIQQTVVSSNIACIGYHEGDMYVLFNSGAAYQYSGVPYDTYLQASAAESVGSFFHKNVKGVYPYSKLDFDPFRDRPRPSPDIRGTEGGPETLVISPATSEAAARKLAEVEACRFE